MLKQEDSLFDESSSVGAKFLIYFCLVMFFISIGGAVVREGPEKIINVHSLGFHVGSLCTGRKNDAWLGRCSKFVLHLCQFDDYIFRP